MRRTKENIQRSQKQCKKRRRIPLIGTAAAILLILGFVQAKRQEALPAGTAIPDAGTFASAGSPDFGNVSDYPPSLIEFMEKYPEATQFVLDYPQSKDRHETINISSVVQKGTLPLFIQWDKRWGYETYGDDFLAVNGCGPTCISMVKCGLSGDTYWNPYEVAKMAEEQDYYVDGVGTSWKLMEEGAEMLGLISSPVSPEESAILNTLCSEMPVICSVYPGDFTYSGHFIILAGVNDDGSIQVLDPNSIKNSGKSWELDVLMPQIRNMWAYSEA